MLWQQTGHEPTDRTTNLEEKDEVEDYLGDLKHNTQGAVEISHEKASA